MRKMLLGIMLLACFCILGCNSGAKKAYEEGNKLLHSGNHEQAILAFSSAIQTNPKYADAYIARATAYTGLEKYANALEDFDQVISQDPKNTQTYFYRGMINAKLGNTGIAMRDLNIACQGGNQQACQTVMNIPAMATTNQMEVDAQQRAMRIPTYMPGPGADLAKTSKTKKELLADAKSALDRDDTATAFKIYQQLAATGDAYSQTMAGAMYLGGSGVPQNISEGIRLIEEATAQGDRGGQYNLGVVYLEGKYLKEDKQKAARLFESAAKQGEGQAQVNLAIMYYMGDGVAKNKAEAVKWCQKAVNQGVPGAKDKLAIISEK